MSRRLPMHTVVHFGRSLERLGWFLFHRCVSTYWNRLAQAIRLGNYRSRPTVCYRTEEFTTTSRDWGLTLPTILACWCTARPRIWYLFLRSSMWLRLRERSSSYSDVRVSTSAYQSFPPPLSTGMDFAFTISSCRSSQAPRIYCISWVGCSNFGIAK